MRRDERQAAALDERLEERHRERRALLGVGSGTELVEQRQTLGPRRPVGFRQARQAPGEGRAVGEQILLVAHRGHEAREVRHLARGGSGDRQAGLGGERQETESLQRHGLAAGVGTGDHQRATLGGELDRERFDRALVPARAEHPLAPPGEPRVEQRVARRDQPQAALGREHR